MNASITSSGAQNTDSGWWMEMCTFTSEKKRPSGSWNSAESECQFCCWLPERPERNKDIRPLQRLCKKYWGLHFWSTGYFVRTVGVNEEYVRWQQKKNCKQDNQKNLFSISWFRFWTSRILTLKIEKDFTKTIEGRKFWKISVFCYCNALEFYVYFSVN